MRMRDAGGRVWVVQRAAPGALTDMFAAATVYSMFAADDLAAPEVFAAVATEPVADHVGRNVVEVGDMVVGYRLVNGSRPDLLGPGGARRRYSLARQYALTVALHDWAGLLDLHLVVAPDGTMSERLW